MLVNYSSSSEEETDNVTKRRPNWHSDDSSLRKKLKSEVQNSKVGHICDDESISANSSGQNKEEDQISSRLPLPGCVLDMFTDEEDPQEEDSLQHGGRIRSFKHERGNWATFVYLPYEPEEEFLELLDEMTTVAASHGVSLTQADEFHLSLSQTVVLRHHWIQPFIQSLRTGLAHGRRLICSAEKLKVYSNSEKTRTFLAMEVSTGHAQLLELVKAVDTTMKEFTLDTFYQNPSFHVSLAWCVGDFTEHMHKKCLQELQNLVDSHEDGPFLLRLNCQELRCKSGNKTFSFALH